MTFLRRQFLNLAAGAAALSAILATVEVAAAQTWPTRPVTMVVAFAAGSGDDVFARIVAPRLSELLGQPVIIENVGGAGGMTGTVRVAKAAPDGYHFVLGGTGTFAANQTLYKNPLYNAATDFAPVALVAEQPMLLITRKDLPVNNLQEFIAYAKANQSKMQFGSGGAGSATHLACVLLNQAIGMNVTHVPYRAAALAIQDMIGGRIDYVCPIASTAIAHIEGKNAKAIAILKTRSPILPNLASAQEQGLAGFEAYFWDAFFLPKDTPAAIVKKLHDATIATMETRAVQDRLKEIGAEFVTRDRRSPEYLQKFVVSEIAKWAAVINAAGVSAD
jgi:tripartite-type tricarboxylate transporter receptor subunit TctC